MQQITPPHPTPRNGKFEYDSSTSNFVYVKLVMMGNQHRDIARLLSWKLIMLQLQLLKQLEVETYLLW